MGDITKDFVEKIEEMAREADVVDIAVNGVHYTERSLKPILFEPRPDTLTVRTLSGLVDYLLENRDGLILADIIVHVRNEIEVVVMSKLCGADRKRDHFLAAKFDGAVFPFGKWLSVEAFIIGVNSLFQPSTGRDEILKYVSAVKVEDEASIIDDGITQSAQARVGIKGNLTELKQAPSRVVLVPFRTFAEVEQPESEFIFRMRRSGDGVELALHEADGGAWKAVAMDRIADRISELFAEGDGAEGQKRPAIIA